jgi:hypothetical protein
MDAGMTGGFDARTLKRRAPVWAALSDLFLDTDVSIFYDDIIRTLRKSRYRPEDVEHILFEEVGPVFYTNVIAENRVWSAWPLDEVRHHILDFFTLDPFDRSIAQHASADVVERIFHEHWPLLQHAVWGDRPSRRRQEWRLPRLPRIQLRPLRLLLWAPVFVVVLLAVLAGYEAVAVMRAQARTPEVLEQAWARAGPPLSRELPVSWLEALLRVEDPGFRRHHGVDFATPGQGMTTITQALVKRLYFERFTPGFAKIEQSLIARFVLDSAITKDEQLDLFLSLAYFGNTDGQEVIGFRSAAQAYFGKALAELDREQFLALVAMLPAPDDLKPGTPANTDRVARIERLLDDGCLPEDWNDVWLEACAP